MILDGIYANKTALVVLAYKSTPDSIQPPADFIRYIKHKTALDTASLNLGRVKSGDPTATQAMVTLLAALTKEDGTHALTNVDIAPYSNSTGHWHPSFSGGATAVYVIPYTRRKHDNGLLGVVAQALTQFLVPGAKVLSALGIDSLNQFLMTPQGTPYGYIQGEIQVVGDVYTGDATEAYKDSIQLPILEDVTLTVQRGLLQPTTLTVTYTPK